MNNKILFITTKKAFAEVSSMLDQFTYESSSSEHFITDQLSEASNFLVKNIPSVIIIDTYLPDINPLSFIEELNKKLPMNKNRQSVIIISSLDHESISKTKEATQKKIVSDFFIKDSEENSFTYFQEIQEYIFKAITVSIKKAIDYNAKVERANNNLNSHIRKNSIDPKLLNNTKILYQKLNNYSLEVIMLGISTGGPAAFRRVVVLLEKLNYPLVIVQHMPNEFIKDYIRSLNQLSKFPVKIAEQGDILEKEHIYIAPGNVHIKIDKIDNNLTILLDHSEAIKNHKPSAEIMYKSAYTNQLKILGIIMTGMGSDGSDYLSLLHNQGTPTIAQSPEDCSIFGMPKALIDKNAADAILAIPDIAGIINKL